MKSYSRDREAKLLGLHENVKKPWKKGRMIRKRLKRYLRRKERHRMPTNLQLARTLSQEIDDE